MEDSKKYFISLDNIDIDYLPRLKEYLQRNECNEVPLWSVLNASKSADEICEFEFFTKDDKDTTTPECDENSTEKCYICDIQVPKTYMQAHCTGEKHRICASILRHALHRATQHAECIPFAPTGLTTKPASLTHSESTYFCDPCALSVNVENKGTHEKTKDHRVSVIHNRLLNGLLITYTDKGRVVADSRYEGEVSIGSNDVSVEDVSRDDDVATTPVDDVDITVAADTAHEFNSDKDEQGIVEEDSDAESIDSIDDNVSDDNWVKPSSNSLTDRDNTNYQEDATTSKKQELVEIVTVSNGIVRVPAKNYHGISYTLTGSISCLICQKTIVDVDAHILEPRHIELVSVPVTDINCIRQISQLWHHCIICNKLVQSIPHHKSSSPHQSKLRSLDVTSKKQQRILKRLNEMSYCDVCNYNIQKNSIECHFNGARHAWNLSRATYTAENRVLHYQFKIDEDKIECAICNIVVRDDDTDAHIVSDAHENNYKRFLVTNHISKLKKSFYCDCCKEKLKLKRTNEIEHSQNVKHKTTVSVYKPKLSIPVNVNSIENFERLDVATIQLLYLLETSNIDKRVTCKVCKHTFKNKSTQIKNHMKQSFHQYNIDALLYVNKIKIKLDGTYFCEVCRRTIDHTKEFDHINSKGHKINLRTKPLESGEDGPSKVTDTPAENSSSNVNMMKDSFDHEMNVRNAPLACRENGNYMTGEAVSPDEKNPTNVCVLDRNTVENFKGKLQDEVVCFIYNADVRADDIDTHIECDHKINVTNVPLSWGERDNDTSEAAVTQTQTENPASNLNVKASNDHEVNVRNTLLACKVNGNDMFGEAVSLAEISTSNVDILCRNTVVNSKRELHSHLKKIKDIIVCLICNVEVRANDIDAHIESEEHNNNYKCFLVKNRLTKSKIGYNCHACNVKTDMSEIVHVNRKKHKTKISVYKPKKLKSLKPSAPVNVNSIQDIEFLDRKKLYLLESSDEPGEIRCKVCKVTMQSNSTQIKGHMTEQYHKFNVDALLYANKIKNKLDGTYFCEVCRITIDRTKEIGHINSNDHEINLRNISWRQRGGDTTVAPFTLSENPCCSENIKNSCDSDINVKNAPLSCRENGNDMSTSAVPTKTYLTYYLDNTTSNVENDHNTVDTSKVQRELNSHLNEIKDEIVCFICNVDVHADDIESHNESVHNINVRNVPLSWRQIGDMAGAAATPTENSSSHLNIKDSYDQEINVRNAPLACREKDNDMARVAVPPAENTTSNAENDHNTVDNSKREIHSHLKEIKDEIVCLTCNVDVRADEIDSQNESNHNINVRNVPSSWLQRGDDMAGAAVTPSENPFSNVNVKDGNNHEINVRNAPLPCREKGNDMGRVAVPPVENTTSNAENDHNTVDNFKREIHSHLKEFKDEIVCLTCNVDVRADEIDSQNESNHNINVRNVPLSWTQIDDDMTGAATAPSEQPTSSGNVKDSNDHEINMKNAPLACKEHDSDNSRVTVSPDGNPCVLDRNTVHNNNRNLHYHLKIVKDEIVCSICNIALRDVDIDAHIESDEHNNNYKTFLVENRITMHKKRLFCHTCRFYMKKTRCETDHIKTKIHIDKMSVHKPKPSIPVDVNTIQGIELLDFATAKLLYLLELCNDEPEKITCKVCKAIMKSNLVQIKKHMTDQYHQFNMDALLYVNKIKNKDGTYFCEVCRSIIGHTKEIDHINRNDHKINVRSWAERDNDISNAAVTLTENSTSNVNVRETLNHIEFEKHKQDIIAQNDIFSLQAIKGIEDFDKIIPIDSEKYFCECCSVHLVKGTVSEHVEKYNHAINVAKYIEKQKTSTSKLKDNNIEKCSSNCKKTVEIPNVKLISHKVNDYFNFKDGEILFANSSLTGSPEVKKDSEIHKTEAVLKAQAIKRIEDCDKIIPIDSEKYFCECCSVPLVKGTVSEHVENYNHAINVAKYIEKQKTSTSKKDKIIEKITSNFIKYIDDGFKDSATSHASEINTGRSRVTKYSIHDMYRYLSAVPSKPKEVMCQICNTTLTTTLTYNNRTIKYHLKGKGHQSKYEKFLVDKKKQLKTKEKLPCDNNDMVPVQAVAKTTKDDTHKTEVLVKAQSIFFKYAEGVLFCRCCNTEVRNIQQDVNLHLSGWRHKVKSSAILAENGLRIDKNKIYCDVCEEFLPNLDGITHIDSSKHKAKVSAKALEYVSNKDVIAIALAAKTNDTKSDKCKISNNNEKTNREISLQDNLLKAKDEKKEGGKGDFCDICKVFVMNMPVHLNSNQHKLTMNLKVNDDITCKVCNLKVNKNDLIQHENGALHNKNFKEILLKNQISQKWNGVLYCQLCDLFFTPVSLIQHVKNENHKK